MKITELQIDKKYSRHRWPEHFYIIILEGTTMFIDCDDEEYSLTYIDIHADDWYSIEEDKDRLKVAINLLDECYKTFDDCDDNDTGAIKIMKKIKEFFEKCEVKNEDN